MCIRDSPSTDERYTSFWNVAGELLAAMYVMKYADVYKRQAQGDVVVTQGNQTLMAPRIEGNTKTTEYRTVGGYHYLEDGGKTKDITGQNMT